MEAPLRPTEPGSSHRRGIGLDSIPEDVVIAIASYLGARDLVSGIIILLILIIAVIVCFCCRRFCSGLHSVGFCFPQFFSFSITSPFSITHRTSSSSRLL
ncbi:unnamed protein product [Spirodela intermedia]|uniref:Uncharacterized protein n=1 Tax=Spirodela intermedia TaxID=51605 RepID=A0ABN7E8D3_SPIIN|nr:unnamed protein product [Spirodela intermedia]